MKTLLDASNIIKQKAYLEYEGNKSLSDYLVTNHGEKKLIELFQRYFNAIELTVIVEGVDVSKLKVTQEVTVFLKDNNYTYFDFNKGDVYFY